MTLPTPSQRQYNAVNREISSDPQVLVRVANAIAMVEEGSTLSKALEANDLKRAMFAGALQNDRELSARYARAREFSADFLVDAALDAAVNEPDVLRARVIAENNRWAAGKFNSKRYGDRIDLNVSQTLDISGTLLEARQRMLRSVSDQQMIENAQVVDVPALPKVGAPDKQSVPVAKDEEPDIFS